MEIKSDEDLEKHGALNLSVLMVLPEGEEEALKRFMNVAMNYDDVAFAHSFNEAHKTSLGVIEKFGFVVFRDFDDGKKFLVNDDVPTVESMKNFFEAIRFPIVMLFDQKAAERIFGSESAAMMYFSDDANDSGLATFRDFAKENQGDVLFTHSTITSGLGARLAEFLGVTSEMSPCVRIIKFNNG